MTYTEWRDELKSNLLCVSESERKRVLDYYAEAYADRREAGFSEHQIINEFGAPYDAAQRILSENKNDEFYDEPQSSEPQQQTRREKRREAREARMQGNYERTEQSYSPPPPPPPQPAPACNYANNTAAKAKSDDSWIFVLLCVIFAIPIFGLIMAMVGVTIGFCVAPIAVIASGGAAVGSAIGLIISGETAYGLYTLGGGIVAMGVGVILCPLFFKLVGLMWKLFNSFFSWLKSLFSTKERT